MANAIRQMIAIKRSSAVDEYVSAMKNESLEKVSTLYHSTKYMYTKTYCSVQKFVFLCMEL